jgi:ubiquinone/menaquinone biosynthesis C-methylase UbiE
MLAHHRILDAVLERCAYLGARTCLDVGCGAGDKLVELVRNGLLCMGLDRDPAMLAQADRRLQDSQLEAVLLEGDAARLPPASGTVDVVTMFDVIGELADVEGALEEARRVLRPRSGLLAFDARMPTGEPREGLRVRLRSRTGRNGHGPDVAPRAFQREELRRLLSRWDVHGIRAEPDGDLAPDLEREGRGLWLVFAVPPPVRRSDRA